MTQESARQRILNRLKSGKRQTKDVPVGSPVAPTEPVHISPERTPQTAAEKLERFCDQLRLSHAEVLCVGEDEIQQALGQHLRENAIKNLLYAPGSVASRRMGDQTAFVETRPFEQPVEQWKAALFDDMEAGISHAQAGIAQTGTLMLATGPSEPRTLSLVPPVHYVLIHEGQIVETLAGAFGTKPWGNTLPTNLLLISGPSKTADIQTTLAYGAHGPKRLVVIVYGGTRQYPVSEA